ncbi:SAM-dependent methyltransferase [Actinomadura miaoliensis]
MSSFSTAAAGLVDRPPTDMCRPNPARVHAYWLGGKDHYAADREEAERILAVAPRLRDVALANRGFMERSVRCLAGRGVAQFLDLGAGLPACPSVYEVARSVNPDARVAYVDNDPVVACHGRALLAVDGAAAMVEADLRDPAALLERDELRRLIDLDRPVAVLLLFVLDYIADADDPAGIVAELAARLAPGSHLVLSHFSDDLGGPGGRRTLAASMRRHDIAMFPRGREEIRGLFAGLDLLEPGLTRLPVGRRRRGAAAPVAAGGTRVCGYGGMACTRTGTRWT